jgi:3-hydroxyisobutyrate dehydrogenase
VSDGPALLETITTMSKALGPGHIILNHATVSPSETKEAARMVEERHAKFLDAPFTGSRDAAAAGEIVFLIGGDAETLALAKPILEANAKSILPVGGIGDATVLKIATNLIAAVTVTALSEAMALLSTNGVALQNLLEILPHHGVRSQLADMKIPSMILDDFEPRFALKHMFKDVQIALAMAADAGIELPAAGSFAGAAMAGIQQGLSDRDFSSIARLYQYPDAEASLEEKFRPAAPQAPTPAPAKPEPRRWKVFGAR